MSSSNIYTSLTLCASEEITTTPATSSTSLAKPTWADEPVLEPSVHHREDFDDTGANWSDNAWPTEDPFKDPTSSLSSSELGFVNKSLWGIGLPVEIPTYHTHYSVLDSMDQNSGYTHYLLESNRGMLFHGHQTTTEWAIVSAVVGDGSEFASLPELNPVPADFLFPLCRPFMTHFSSDGKDEAVYMKKQAFLSRNKFRNDHHASCTWQEISRCEHIAKAPHPNLAKYLGVETRQIGGEERVVEIAYQRYSMDLHTFVLMKRFLQPHHVSFLMQGIEQGMRHLHKLGLVHCDLRPMNVFVTIEEQRDEKDHVILKEVVIGDFDASVEVDSAVALKRANGGWWPADMEWGAKAAPWIDEWCLENLRKWLKEDGLGEWDFGATNTSPSEGSVNALAGDIMAKLPSNGCW